MISRKTNEMFLQQMKEKHPNIEILSEYKNSQKKVKCRCLKDKYEWFASPNKLLDCGHGCPKCGSSLKLTTDIFIEQMKKINPNITIIGEYINSNTPIEIHCNICNNIWKARPYHLKSGENCPICSKKKMADKYRKKTEDFKQEMAYVDPTIVILGNYINSKTKIHCKCLVCNKEWESIPSNLLKGRGCSKCSASKGEKRIMSWLDKNHIDYKKEYTYIDCKYKRKLPFDFYIPSLNCLIEYDGQQHFIPVQMGGMTKEKAEQVFKETQIRDKIKNDYCSQNNIPLYRISYKEYNKIDKILEKIFLI